MFFEIRMCYMYVFQKPAGNILKRETELKINKKGLNIN